MQNTNIEIARLITYARAVFKNTTIENIKHLIKCINNSLNNIQCLVFFDFLFSGISSIKLKSLIINSIGIDNFIKLFDNFIDKNVNELLKILDNILNINTKSNNEYYSLCLLEKFGNNKIIKLTIYTYNQSLKLNVYKQICNIYLNNNKIKHLINLLNNLDVKELNLIKTDTNLNTDISENLSFINIHKFLYNLHIIDNFSYQLFKNEIKKSNINSIYLLNIINKISNNNNNNIYKNKLEFKAYLLDSCVKNILSIISNIKSNRNIKVSLEERMYAKLLNSLFKKINDSEIKELYNTEYVKTSLKTSIEHGQISIEELKNIYLNNPTHNQTTLYINVNTIGTFIETEIINRDFKKTKQSAMTNANMSLMLNRVTHAVDYCNFLQHTTEYQHK